MRAAVRIIVLAFVGVGCLALPLGLPVPASADPSLAIIDSRSPELTQPEGGERTTKVGLTNLTDGKMVLSLVVPSAQKDVCVPTADHESIEGSEPLEVKVTIPASCTVTAKKFTFDLIVEADGRSQLFKVTAVDKAPEPEPIKWESLLVFPIALLLFLLIFMSTYWRVTPKKIAYNEAVLAHALAVAAAKKIPDGARQSEAKAAVRAAAKQIKKAEAEKEAETWQDVFWAPLKHLEATWTLTGSPISSVAAAGSLLTAIFATGDTLKIVFDFEETPELALSLVGAGISAAFIAVAPLAIAVMSVTPDKSAPRNQFGSVFGLWFASSLSIAAALGILFVVYQTGIGLDLTESADKWLTCTAILAAALTVVYGLRATFQTLRLGLIAPPKESETETLSEVELLESILESSVPADQRDAVRETSQQIQTKLPSGASVKESTSLAESAYKADPQIDNAIVDQAMDLAESIGGLVAEPEPRALGAKSATMI